MALNLEEINKYFEDNPRLTSSKTSLISQYQNWPSYIKGHKALELIQRDGRVCFSFNGGNFCGMDLPNVNFSYVDLGRAFFNRANMKNADLTRALLGDAKLVGTDLRGALGLGDRYTPLGEGVIIGHSDSATRLPDSLLREFSVLVPNDKQERTDDPLSNVKAWFQEQEREREENPRGSTLINITPIQSQPDSRDRKPLTIYIPPDHFEWFFKQVILDIQSLKEREAQAAQAEIAKNIRD